MPAPTSDIKTKGYVLRRTNYGEADRILNLITPIGKLAVIARGVRKSRSKLAGGIEMFMLSDYNIHRGRGEFGTLIGVKLQHYYDKIIKDFTRMELAAKILKQVNRASEGSDNPEYFRLVEQTFTALDSGYDIQLIEAWFMLNLLRATGEEVNLYRDNNGDKLIAGQNYDWGVSESCFITNNNGIYNTDMIKILRLITTTDFTVVTRVKFSPELLHQLLKFASVVSE